MGGGGGGMFSRLVKCKFLFLPFTFVDKKNPYMEIDIDITKRVDFCHIKKWTET